MKRLLVIAILALAGCVDLKSAYPEKKFYTLEAERSGAARPTAEATVLRIRRFSASKAVEGSEIVFRTGENEYESDFYNVFFVPPAAQLTEQAHRWIGNSRLFATVVGTGSSIAETHILEGHVIALHGDRRNRDAPKAILEAQFMLIDVSADPARVLLQKGYREMLPVPKDEVDGFVRTWREGLAKILASLEADLTALDRSPRKQP